MLGKLDYRPRSPDCDTDYILDFLHPDSHLQFRLTTPKDGAEPAPSFSPWYYHLEKEGRRPCWARDSDIEPLRSSYGEMIEASNQEASN